MQELEPVKQLPKCFWCEKYCHAECANLIYGDSYVAKQDERECSCSCQYDNERVNFAL